jgi:ligand-binding sensor domain-containing protein
VSLCEDSRGTLWVGTDGQGLNALPPGRGGVYPLPAHARRAGISNNFIHCLYEDRAGRLWIATKAGLNRYDRDRERSARTARRTACPATWCTASSKTTGATCG